MQGRENIQKTLLKLSSSLRWSGPPLNTKLWDVSFNSKQCSSEPRHFVVGFTRTSTESPGEGQLGQPGFKMLLLLLVFQVKSWVVPYTFILLSRLGETQSNLIHQCVGEFSYSYPSPRGFTSRAFKCLNLSPFSPETLTRRSLPC